VFFAIIEQRITRSVQHEPIRKRDYACGRLLATVSAAAFAAVAGFGSAQQPPGAHSSPLQPPADVSPAADTPQPAAPPSGAEPAVSPAGGAEIPPLDEEAPPPSGGLLLSSAQLRFCLAQSIRISAVRPLLDRTKVEQVEYLNAMVADFNKRCASQRYPVPALEDAKRVVEANRPLIQADARSAFVKRFGTAAAAAPKPAGEAPKQPEPQAPIAQPPSQAVAQPKAETPKVQPESQQAPAQPAGGAAALPQPQTQKPEPEPATSQPSPQVAAEQKAVAPPQPSQPEVPQVQPAAAAQESTAPPRTEPSSAPPSTPSPPAPGAAPTAPAATAEPSADEASGSRAAEAPPASKPTPRPGGQAALRDPALERYTREVQRAGSRVLAERDYPPQAKGKGLKGTVQIEVLFTGGYIRSILLGESCGHPALDEKALEIARSAKFPFVPKGLRSREFSVRFPIEFRLRKG
jgi:TonB family protein